MGDEFVREGVLESAYGLTPVASDWNCPNCSNTSRIVQYGVKQCESCGYPMMNIDRIQHELSGIEHGIIDELSRARWPFGVIFVWIAKAMMRKSRR
jgi:hypothetical protein